MQSVGFRDRISPSEFLNLCSGTLVSMMSVSFPGKHTKIDVLPLPQLKEPCHPLAYILHSDPAWASLNGSGVPSRGCLHSSLQQRATESVSWRPGLFIPYRKHFLRWPCPCVTRSSPVPLTSFAFPSFSMFVKLLVSVRDAVWSQVGSKARRPARSGLPDPVTETQSQLDSFSLETKP